MTAEHKGRLIAAVAAPALLFHLLAERPAAAAPVAPVASGVHVALNVQGLGAIAIDTGLKSLTKSVDHLTRLRSSVVQPEDLG